MNEKSVSDKGEESSETEEREEERESERENRGIRLVRVTSSCHGYMIHKEFGTTAALLSDKKGAERAYADADEMP